MLTTIRTKPLRNTMLTTAVDCSRSAVLAASDQAMLQTNTLSLEERWQMFRDRFVTDDPHTP